MFLARILLPLTLSLFALPTYAQTDPNAVSASGTAPAADASSAAPSKFRGDQIDGPSGSHAFVAFVDAAGNETPLVSVLTGATVKGVPKTPVERAGIVASRLQGASIQDKAQLESIKPDTKGSQIVLLIGGNSNSTDDGLIMTADAKSRKRAGFKTDQEYALALLNNIKQALLPKLRDAKFDFQLNDQERQERANLYLNRGDLTAAQDPAHAEALFHQAILVKSDFATAYLALAKLQLKEGKRQEAENTLRTGRENGAALADTFANNYADNTDQDTKTLMSIIQQVNS